MRAITSGGRFRPLSAALICARVSGENVRALNFATASADIFLPVKVALILARVSGDTA
jgi:hypothetical protein